MNVASLDLCKELYELSGWEDTKFEWRQWLAERELNDTTGKQEITLPDPPRVEVNAPAIMEFDEVLWPAYDLGYLMRKLDEHVVVIIECHKSQIDKKELGYQDYHFQAFKPVPSSRYNDPVGDVQADTPEDAAAKLAIELFKQGVLVRTK